MFAAPHLVRQLCKQNEGKKSSLKYIFLLVGFSGPTAGPAPPVTLEKNLGCAPAEEGESIEEWLSEHRARSDDTEVETVAARGSFSCMLWCDRGARLAAKVQTVIGGHESVLRGEQRSHPEPSHNNSTAQPSPESPCMIRHPVSAQSCRGRYVFAIQLPRAPTSGCKLSSPHGSRCAVTTHSTLRHC